MFTVRCALCETDVNGATVVVVEHADQHPAGLLGEPAHVAVDESLLQLRGGDVAAPVGVHSHEPLPHLLLMAEVVHVGINSVTLLTTDFTSCSGY